MGFIRTFIRSLADDRAQPAGKHAKPRRRGRHRAPAGGVQCNYPWETKNSDHEHRCGSAPHNRGDHFCYGGPKYQCGETLPYK